MTIYEVGSFLIASISIFTYVIVLSKIYHGWDSLEETFIDDQLNQNPVSFSIIIAARNEALNIGLLLQSINNLDYNVHHLQVIVANDNSTDATFEIASSYSNVESINLVNKFGKKAAMEAGTDRATNDYLWFIDADTLVNKDEAKLLQRKINESDPDFIACPVVIETQENTLSDFQFLDTAAMMAITANGITRKTYFLANGANMVVKKAIFKKVDGFSDNENIASGDDVFLIKKIVQTGGKVSFLKSNRAAVKTQAEPTWTKFLSQRKRWANKTKDYASSKLMRLQGFVFYIHLLILIYFISSPVLGVNLWIGLVMLFIKAGIDFLLLSKTASFFQNKKALKSFIPSFFLYFFYIFFTGYHALYPKKYMWKDRENKK